MMMAGGIGITVLPNFHDDFILVFQHWLAGGQRRRVVGAGGWPVVGQSVSPVDSKG